MKKYGGVIRKFNDYCKSLKNAREKAVYREGTESKVNNEIGMILGCKRIIEQARLYDIPENILLSVPHPELFPYIETQCNVDSCSTASIRTTALLKYGKRFNEPYLWEMNSYKKSRGLRGADLIKDGLGPAEVAEVIRHIEKKFFNRDIKLFATPNGNVEQLEEHLINKEMPIIVRPWGYAPWEVDEDKRYNIIMKKEKNNETHYESVWAADENNVYLCNSENGARNMGLHIYSHGDFLEWWAYGHEGLGKIDNKDGERWYVVPVLGDNKLRKDVFRGKYL